MSHYPSPLGDILLAADEIGLTGLWFAGQKHFPQHIGEEKDLAVFIQAGQWLDLYFSGRKPDLQLPLHLIGTDFQIAVWDILRTIPYGQTTSYGKIAAQLRPGMSAQAVGAAVGKNPVSIIVPCHRVLGTNGNLTGYAGGIKRKTALLQLEGILPQSSPDIVVGVYDMC